MTESLAFNLRSSLGTSVGQAVCPLASCFAGAQNFAVVLLDKGVQAGSLMGTLSVTQTLNSNP